MTSSTHPHGNVWFRWMTPDVPWKGRVFAIRPIMRSLSGASWNPPGGMIEVSDNKPVEQILRDLARPSNTVVVWEPDGSMSNTGPFDSGRVSVNGYSSLTPQAIDTHQLTN